MHTTSKKKTSFAKRYFYKTCWNTVISFTQEKIFKYLKIITLKNIK